MENKNNDILKLDNLEKNERLVTKSILEPKIEKVEEKQRKISLFSIILASFSPKKDTSDGLFDNVLLTKTVKILILLVLMSLLLVLFYTIGEIQLILPVSVIFASVACPLLLTSFHYELCPERKISLFQMIFSIGFGIVLYLTINILIETILIKSIYEQTINMIIVPILWGLGELIIVSILAKAYNISDLLSGVLVAVCVGMGYVFTWCLNELVLSFFTSVKVTFDDGLEYLMYAILNVPSYLEQGYERMLEKVLMYSIYYPIIFSCWSVVIGNTVSLKEVRGAKKLEKSTSLYLLIIFVIVLYSLSVFATSFSMFDVILKILCLVVSLFIAVLMDNSALNATLLNRV